MTERDFLAKKDGEVVATVRATSAADARRIYQTYYAKPGTWGADNVDAVRGMDFVPADGQGEGDSGFLSTARSRTGRSHR